VVGVSDGCHGNHLHLDVKEEEEAVGTCCHGVAVAVEENHFQSGEEVEVDYGDELAVEEMVRGSVICMEEGETVEVHGDDDVGAVAVDDEGAGAASWRLATTLCENLDCYLYHLCSSYQHHCRLQSHRSLRAHAHYAETVLAVEPAHPCLLRWNYQ